MQVEDHSNGLFAVYALLAVLGALALATVWG